MAAIPNAVSSKRSPCPDERTYHPNLVHHRSANAPPPPYPAPCGSVPWQPTAPALPSEGRGSGLSAVRPALVPQTPENSIPPRRTNPHLTHEPIRSTCGAEHHTPSRQPAGACVRACVRGTDACGCAADVLVARTRAMEEVVGHGGWLAGSLALALLLWIDRGWRAIYRWKKDRSRPVFTSLPVERRRKDGVDGCLPRCPYIDGGRIGVVGSYHRLLI
jgi:hypothetical protein